VIVSRVFPFLHEPISISVTVSLMYLCTQLHTPGKVAGGELLVR
jgi:hypothetical protein